MRTVTLFDREISRACAYAQRKLADLRERSCGGQCQRQRESAGGSHHLFPLMAAPGERPRERWSRKSIRRKVSPTAA